jgi:hypothetical protein
MTARIGPGDVLRARRSLAASAPGASGRVLLLDHAHGRYYAVPDGALYFLEVLAESELGMTGREAADAFPDVDLDRLVDLGAVEHVPAAGRRIPMRLIIEFAVTNLWFRFAFRLCGWRLIRRRWGPAARPVGARPVLLDECEAAANIAFAVPGTDRICTVVALTLHRMLVRRMEAARIVVGSDSDQPFLHAWVEVAGHRVDPGDDVSETNSFRPLGICVE